jgi:hypothetical protein
MEKPYIHAQSPNGGEEASMTEALRAPSRAYRLMGDLLGWRRRRCGTGDLGVDRADQKLSTS